MRIAGADNFWQMGEFGPCGPCSEIFYDHGEHIAGRSARLVEAEGDRFIEIWNLVFMQFEQLPGGKRVDLPKPSIDTGMGLERIAAVLQGTHDNYKIDLFGAIISHVADLTGRRGGRPARGVASRHRRSPARGVLPHRRRRAALERGPRLCAAAHHAPRHGHAQLLGRNPLMWRLVPTLVREMGQAYPELARPQQALITETLKLKGSRFRRTLERGLSILDDESRTLRRGDMLKGETAFTLYDAYGFPSRSHPGWAEVARHRRRYRWIRHRHAAPTRESARGLGGNRRCGNGSGVVRGTRKRPERPNS